MSGTMTRADLIADIVQKISINRQTASTVLETLLSQISSTLIEGDSVKISSFGTFSIRKKKERVGRNPRTGEEAVITPRQVISFKASPVFKKRVENTVADPEI